MRGNPVENSYVIKVSNVIMSAIALEVQHLENLCVFKLQDHAHDDLVQLDSARTFGGFIITNDRLKDHLVAHPTLRNVIENLVVRFRVERTTLDPVELGGPNGRYFTGMDFVLLPKT